MVQANPPGLIDLQRALKRVLHARLATQMAMSRNTGVPQSTISKAKRGMLRRETAGTRLLLKYANSLLEPPAARPAIEKAVTGFFSAGGREAELLETITLATRLVLGRRGA